MADTGEKYGTTGPFAGSTNWFGIPFDVSKVALFDSNRVDCDTITPSNDLAIYGGFGFGLTSEDNIVGIKLRVVTRKTAGGNFFMRYRFSPDQGSSWSDPKQLEISSTNEAWYELGSPTDMWGFDWKAADFTDNNFRIELAGWVASTGKGQIDTIRLRVYYEPRLAGSIRGVSSVAGLLFPKFSITRQADQVEQMLANRLEQFK